MALQAMAGFSERGHAVNEVSRSHTVHGEGVQRVGGYVANGGSCSEPGRRQCSKGVMELVGVPAAGTPRRPRLSPQRVI